MELREGERGKGKGENIRFKVWRLHSIQLGTATLSTIHYPLSTIHYPLSTTHFPIVTPQK
jgi:hypothetical protein